MTKIALISTPDRASGVHMALDLLGENPVNGQDVILKPNFNSADPPPGSTGLDTLRSLILKLRDMGAASITVAERSGPPDTQEVMEEIGVVELSKEMDFSLVNLDTAEYVHLPKKPGSYWQNGFHFPKIYHEAQCIVETCCLKTHAPSSSFTFSLKLAVGLVPRDNYSYMKELHDSEHIRKMITDINTVFTPDLIVMDGVTAFVDGGPGKGTRNEAQIMYAGTDRIAIDAVGVAILRILGTTPEVSEGTIFEQEQIARAVELGLGVTSPSEIELVTDSKKASELAAAIRQQLDE